MSSQNDIGTISIKDICYETFQDYKKTGMLIATCSCDWKCLREKNLDISICQNCSLAKQKSSKVEISNLVKTYLSNPITSSVIFGGLEPFLQFDEVLAFIVELRKFSVDDVVIYTGYYPEEVSSQIEMLKQYKNIIIKFGRFVPNDEGIFDEILGIRLSSKNQFARRIS